MSVVLGSTSIQYPLIRFNVGSENVVSQISFDVRDFIPGNVKPFISGGIGGAFVPFTGTIRFGTPDDAVGVDGDWFAQLGDQMLFEKVAGQYTRSNIRGASLRFTYQGWRAVGTVVDVDAAQTPGRCITGFNGGEPRALALNAALNLSGDINLS